MRPNDELTPLERQLAACRPAATGLDADAMLFAAGKAAGRESRLIWTGVAGVFAFISVALGAALVGERSERLALAAQLDRQAAEFAEAIPSVPTTTTLPATDGFFAARRTLEDNWTPSPESQPDGPVVPSAEPPIVRAWRGLSAELP
jgi:hypothetical protein